jgi:peptidyl-prolyl cis-trans isomerase B (cyclophilin B)
MYDTLGRLPYTRADADRVEAALVGAAERPSGADVAERAIVNLIARDRPRPVAAETLVFLENRARGADTWPVRLQAWRALQLLGEKRPDLIATGMSYRCTPGPDCGWQVREIAIDLADPHDATQAAALATARRDPSINVRLAALRRQARLFAETKQCAPLVATAADPSESTVVHLEAMSLLDAQCADRDVAVARLSAIAGAFVRPAKTLPDWHEPARALEALARFDEAAARPALAAAAASPVWQVRAAAAKAATTLKDESTLVALAHDRASNVATEALKGLTSLKSPQAAAVSIAALESPASDYQLVRQAAETLRGDAPSRAEVAPLLSALARLTAEGKDTSRDPRTSILNRLKALAMQKDANGASWVPGGDPALLNLPKDFDPDIAALSAAVIGVATGTTPTVRPTERLIEQPTEAELRDEPGSATVTLTNGDRFQMTLLKNEAPLAVARFAKLVRAGYYHGLTFHRVESLFVVQGGSPQANEYGGGDRFWRDEIGLEHNTAGAVGLSTRGRDTADGQIYIDLTDQYRLDFTYTVVARVADLAVVTRLLEGAEIKDIKLGK